LAQHGWKEMKPYINNLELFRDAVQDLPFSPPQDPFWTNPSPIFTGYETFIFSSSRNKVIGVFQNQEELKID